jgi:hypothetical protein
MNLTVIRTLIQTDRDRDFYGSYLSNATINLQLSELPFIIFTNFTFIWPRIVTNFLVIKELSETCRVSCQNRFVKLVGIFYKEVILHVAWYWSQTETRLQENVCWGLSADNAEENSNNWALRIELRVVLVRLDASSLVSVTYNSYELK